MPVPALVPHRRGRTLRRIEVEVGGRRTLALTPGDGLVRVGLVLPVLDRVIDVTVQPSASCVAVHAAADRAGGSRLGAETATRDALAAAVGQADAWEAPAGAPLLAALGGAAFPMLAAAYARGMAPLDEVPRWATPILASRSARAGCVAAFGPKATRPVVRAFAAGLTAASGGASGEGTSTGAVVQLLPLAMAVMGADVLEPDQLARVLAAAPCADAVSGPLPDGQQIQAGRRCLERWGAHRSERALVGAVTQRSGVRLLTRAVRFANDLDIHGPTRLPNRLGELHDVYRAATATDPGHRPTPAALPRPTPACPARQVPARPDPPTAVPPADRPPIDQRERTFAPARRLPPVGEACPLVIAPAVLAMDGLAVGSLQVVVPRTAGDLVRWSRLLRNCLYDYGPLAAEGRTTIIGVEREGRLHYAVEVVPPGVIRQFVGPANRPPDAADRAAVVATLVAHGVIDRTDPANATWLRR